MAAAHRRSDVAITLARQSRDLLRERWTGGDTRAGGVIIEVENAGLKQAFPQADWLWIDFMFIDAVAGLPQIQAGKVNAIAVAGAKRAPALPQVATVAETYPHIDMQAWQTIAAPKGTPMAVVNRLNAEMNKLLETPELRATLLKLGVDANPMSVQALNELIATDEKRFGDLVRAVGVKAN